MSLHARRPPRGVERRFRRVRGRLFAGREPGFSRGAADRRRRDPQPFSRGRALAGLASSAAPAGARAALQGVVRGGISEGRAPRAPVTAPVTAAVTRRSRGSHGAIDRGGAHRNSGRRERSTPGPSGLVRAASVSVRAPPRDVVRGPLALSFPVTRPRRGSARSSRPARALCGALCGASGESGGRTSPHGPRASRSRRVA